MSDDAHAVKAPDWEIKRQLRPGCFRVYAHGYFAPTWSVTVFIGRPRTIVGRGRLARAWARHSR